MVFVTLRGQIFLFLSPHGNIKYSKNIYGVFYYILYYEIFIMIIY